MTSASHRGQGPALASCRRSTPTTTTNSPSAATPRQERNLLRTVTGDFTRSDRQALEQLQITLAA